MKQELMKETKIGDKLSIGASCEEKEIGIYIASEDVSASVAFHPEEFVLFCEAIRKISQRWEGLEK